MNKPKEGKKKNLWLILMLVCLLAAVIAAGVLLGRGRSRNAAEERLAALAEAANETKETEASESSVEPEEDIPEEPGIEIPEKRLDWEALREENADIYAWVYVPETDIDYPVLRHPSDNSYYLNHNLDGSSGYPGCIYTEDYNSLDFTDFHTVLYGHNLKDGTMFSTLHYFEDPENVETDHYFYLYTEDGAYAYRIFAAYEFPAIHVLANYDLTNEYVREQYLKDLFAMDETDARVANIRHDIEVTGDDRIVTLSTCASDHDAARRFLVVGVQMQPEEG